MSISLQKGQKVNLSKERAGLSKVIVGLGWDEAKPKEETRGETGKEKKGFLGRLFGVESDSPVAKKVQTIDCDASAFLLRDGKLKKDSDIVCYYNLHHKSGAVNHQGDNLTGAGEGDDEQIIIDLSKVPEKFNKIEIVVNIYHATSKHQHFGMIENAFIRLVDERTGEEICRYNLTDDYSGMTAMIFGEVYRRDGEWKFNAVGQGTKDPDIESLARRFS